MAPRSRIAGWGRAASAVAVVGVLFGFELALRASRASHRDSIREETPGRELCTTASDRLVYTFVPGRCGHNAHGFPDHERRYQRRAGTLRVVVIGDSVAQGQGMARAERFADRLVPLLTPVAGRPVEVVVLARTGYSTSQQVELLRDEARRYAPDLVLWSYVLNDPAHPVFHDANGQLGAYWYQPELELWALLRRAAFRWTERRAGARCRNEFHARLHCVFFDEIAARFAEIGALSRAHRLPVLMVVHPVHEASDSFADYSLIDVHRLLGSLAERNELALLDLTDAYSGRRPEALAQRKKDGSLDGWHPNAEGHRLAATAIAAAIEERGLLRVKRGSAPHPRPPAR